MSMHWLVSEDGDTAICLSSGMVLRVSTRGDGRCDILAFSAHAPQDGPTLRVAVSPSREEARRVLRAILAESAEDRSRPLDIQAAAQEEVDED